MRRLPAREAVGPLKGRTRIFYSVDKRVIGFDDNHPTVIAFEGRAVPSGRLRTPGVGSFGYRAFAYPDEMEASQREAIAVYLETCEGNVRGATHDWEEAHRRLKAAKEMRPVRLAVSSVARLRP